MSTILKKKDKQTTAKLKGRNMIKSNRERERRKFRRDTGYIYLGRIPHGFYEDQMTAYFSQFGKVLSAYVPRSKKTGRSKGYGFVEFKDEEVAKIAAETMNNYLMYNKVIKCSYIPPEERKNILKNRTSLISPKVINRRKTLADKKRQLSKLSLNAYQKQTERKMLDFKRFFEERGIEFTIKLKGNDAENSNLNDIAAQKEESESVNDIENEMNEFGVLEIDTSDTDIHFQTPPQVKKVFKKSSNGSVISHNDNLQTQKKPKIKRPTRLKSEEPKQAKKCQKLAKKGTKSSTGKNETKVKLPRAQKSEALKKRKALGKRKKPKKKEDADDSLTLKKDKNKKENNSTKLLCKKILSGTLSGK